MKNKLLLAAIALLSVVGTQEMVAQASYNISYTEGVEVAEGDYFLYNVGAKAFLADGMNWGTHATADHAGRVVTLATVSEEPLAFSLFTKSYTSTDKQGYMTLNGYLDTGSNDANWVFTPVEYEGYTNVYTIKHSDTQYLYYNAADMKVNVGNSTSDNNSYWMLIPRSIRETAKDYTYLLQNSDFNRPWERVIWSLSAGFTNQSGGNNDNRCAEVYHKVFDMYQTVSTVPNGKYILYNQGFYRKDSGDDSAYLYANESASALALLNANGEGTTESMAGASTSFSAGHYVNSIATVVTDNKLTVGVKNTNAGNWVIFDNFFLSYLGTTLLNDAVALPESGEMVADTWYYFDVPATAEYNISATTLSDVVYTTDGTQLTSEASGEGFSAAKLELAASRYFIKSSSANAFSVSAAEDVYTLGDAATNIVEGSYISELTTFVVTYPNASSTNAEAVLALIGDAKATLAKDGATVAEGTLTADAAAKTLTATFADVKLELNSAYTISIAAGVFGYEGKAVNEALNVNFNTLVVEDGYYYLYNTYTQNYISRAGHYGTQAIMDNYGLAVYLHTDSDGLTTVQFFDNALYLGDDGFCYADVAANNARLRKYSVTKVEDGYKFLNTNNSKYLAVYANQAVGDAVEGGNLEGTSNVWALETLENHAANYVKNANTQAVAAATAAGIEGITTMAGLKAYIDENYGTSSIEVTGAEGEKYQQAATNVYESVEAVYYTDTVDGLKPGLYKLSVDAFQRAATNDAVATAGGARGLAYVYAGDAKTQVKSVMEYASETQYAGTDYVYEGKYYPNREATGITALKTGNYNNEVFVYVAAGEDGTGSLIFGINNPTYIVNRQTWAVYRNFTLTYYEAKATDEEKTALTAAIAAAEVHTPGFLEGEYAPYNNVEGMTALAAAKAIDLNTASSNAVIAATTALTSATWTANTEEMNAIYDGSFAIQEENTTSPITVKGWNVGDGLRQLIKNVESYPGLNDASSQAAIYVWNGTYSYGNVDGYTMPLKANTVYELSFLHAGWTGANNTFNVSVLNEDEEGLAVTNVGGASKGINSENSLTKATVKFTTGAAGNYVLKMNPSGNAVFTDIKLYSVPESSVTMTVKEDCKYATFIAPFDVELPTGVTASKITGVEENGYTLTEEAVEGTIPANTPVVLYSEAPVSETFTGYSLATQDSYTVGLLTGTHVDYQTVANTDTYVLQNHDGAEAFYYVGESAQPWVRAGHCYLVVAAAEGAPMFSFDRGEGTTSIDNAQLTNDNEVVIYDLAGRRVQKMEKGIYIVGGRKVIK